jgi:hypothetical protein
MQGFAHQPATFPGLLRVGQTIFLFFSKNVGRDSQHGGDVGIQGRDRKGEQGRTG